MKFKTISALLNLLAMVMLLLAWVSTFFTDDAARIARTAGTISLCTYFLNQKILIEIDKKS